MILFEPGGRATHDRQLGFGHFHDFVPQLRVPVIVYHDVDSLQSRAVGSRGPHAESDSGSHIVDLCRINIPEQAHKPA